MYLALVPSPHWLSAGDTSWQLTAATLVGLMSIPGLALMYAGLMKRKWSLNSAAMTMYAFSITLVVWTLWAYSMSFGSPIKVGPGLLGIPWPVNFASAEINQASIPLLKGLMPPLQFPSAALVYFQFVFAAITVIILGGSLLGRMNFKAWMLFVPLWITFVYSVGAFALWGGGWLSQLGAVDYSGGYVIHVAAGTSGAIAAWVLGPRLLKDRESNNPSNLLIALAGAGLLWLGWNGFNGGDPYFAGGDAAAAVLNTNLATGTALVVWMFLDVFFKGRASLAGMISGMVCGLVGITPGAGYVDGFGAIIVGIVATAIPWMTSTYLVRLRFFQRIDDTLGVMHTHLFAGAAGGLLTGLLANPAMIVYYGTGKTANVSVTGLFYGNPHQFAMQAVALVFIVAYNIVATFVIMKVVGLVVPLRMPAQHLEVGDELVHGEVSLDLGQPHEGVIPTEFGLQFEPRT